LAVGGDFDKVIVYDKRGNKVWESGNLGGDVAVIRWFPDGSGLVVGGYIDKIFLFRRQNI